MLTIRDVRLKGWRPEGDTVMEVDENSPLSWFVAFCNDVAEKFKNQVYLRLCAHGRGIDGLESSQGGNGLMFTAGDLGWERLYHLQPLFRRFRGGVDLYVCGAAYVNPGWAGHGAGDGNFFCSKMAQTLGTNVRASTAKQVYMTGSWRNPHLHFDQWEGTVLTYGPKGGVIKVEQGASAAPLPDPLPD